MGEFVINLDKINNSVMPELNNSLIYVQKASDNVNKLVNELPSDFSSRQTVLNIVSNVNFELNTDISNLIDFYKSKIETISTNDTSHKNKIASLLSDNKQILNISGNNTNLSASTINKADSANVENNDTANQQQWFNTIPTGMLDKIYQTMSFPQQKDFLKTLDTKQKKYIINSLSLSETQNFAIEADRNLQIDFILFLDSKEKLSFFLNNCKMTAEDIVIIANRINDPALFRLTEVLEPTIKEYVFNHISDQRVLNIDLSRVPNEPELCDMDQVYGWWSKIIHTSLKNGRINDILRYISNDNLVKVIEHDISIAPVLFSLLNSERLKYVMFNLEGLVKNKVANKCRMSEFYDGDVNNLDVFCKNEMINSFKKCFGQYIPPEKFSEVENNCLYYNANRFDNICCDSRAMAFNDGNNSVMNLSYDDIMLKANISHESLHQLSTNIDSNGNYCSGFQINYSNIGINECTTELLNEITLGDNYPTLVTGKIYNGYQEGVDCLKLLIDTGVIEYDKLENAYFSNNPNYLKESILALGFSEFAYNKLITAFDDMISSDFNTRYEASDFIWTMSVEISLCMDGKW